MTGDRIGPRSILDLHFLRTALIRRSVRKAKLRGALADVKGGEEGGEKKKSVTFLPFLGEELGFLDFVASSTRVD